MTVRRAAIDDAEQLFDLYSDLVGDAALGGAAHLATVLDHPGTSIWCVELDRRLVAMASLHLLPNVTQGGRPYAVIENVVTCREVRGRGHGRALMLAAIEAAWQQNAYKIMLMTGRSAQAKGFYEALGFRADEKWAMTLRRAPRRQGR